MANQMEENPPGSGDSVAGGPPTLTLEDPRCQLAPADRDPGCPVMPTGTHAGMAPGTHAGMAPGTGAAPGGVALTIGDTRCAVGLAPMARDSSCPNFGTP